MKLLEFPVESRPRERLQKLGLSALSEAELLAIIMQKGTVAENVIDMSNRLLSRYSLARLSTLSLNELQSVRGIGPAKAAQLLAVFELGKRYASCKHESSKPLISAEAVYEYANPKLGGCDKEKFLVLMLDSKNRVVKDEIVSIGILNASIVHPREVFKSAIKESANAIILVHNHPSGDPVPSEEDRRITAVLKEAGRLLNIEVLDHVIIGKNAHYSFAKEGGI
ncbi:DNA repair protein RadC [Candidatus Woesearchaeota archaeon]|nr:DNA repair protein RadC [Candidatus Woesearchaeota archaeon]